MFKTNRHSCYDLEYHLVVVTKYRHPVITKALRKRLISISKQLLTKNWSCTINSINTDKDHIHILLEIPPQVKISTLINNYKTVTSRMLKKEFKDELKPFYWKEAFWSDTYFISSVSERSHTMIKNYIATQNKANPA